MHTDRLPVIRARAPAPLEEAIRRYAARCGSTPSAALRELVIDALLRRGCWPPEAVVAEGPASAR